MKAVKILLDGLVAKNILDNIPIAVVPRWFVPGSSERKPWDEAMALKKGKRVQDRRQHRHMKKGVLVPDQVEEPEETKNHNAKKRPHSHGRGGLRCPKNIEASMPVMNWTYLETVISNCSCQI